jgi:hypothetical protein
VESELAALTDAGLAPFAQALFARQAWLEAIRQLASRADWPGRRESLLRDAEIDACARSYEPKERCVLEQLLVQLGESGEPQAIPRLRRIADTHPQRELRIRALHGLASAGPGGIDAAAGPVGAPPSDTDSIARTLRARAALLRGDPLVLAIRGGPDRAAAVLAALADFADRERALADDGSLGVVIDALFDAALATHAKAVLAHVPPARWKSRVKKRKRAERPIRLRPATAKQRTELDAELRGIRESLSSIVTHLVHEGFDFVGTPLSPPPRRFATQLRALERRVGPVPLALARFWAIVGSVDLRGNHPRWSKRTYVERGDDSHWLADPLVVAGIESALADAEEADFEVRDAPSALRYVLDLAGDDVTKANFSGGIVSVETPATAIDPALRGRAGTFLEMVRASIAWSGFPGFARIPDAPPGLRALRRAPPRR